MDTALPQKFPFILDRNLAKANCTGNRVCTSCDTVVLDIIIKRYAFISLNIVVLSLVLRNGVSVGDLKEIEAISVL